MTDKIKLYYGHDPMCSFCWGFRPVWNEIQKQLAESATDLEIVYIMGGLAPDSDEPMPMATREKLITTWQYIQKQIPDTRFNFDFWKKQTPRRSTYPACRAVMAIKMLDPALEDKMILAIQTAYYLEALNPSDDDTLAGCASSIGIDEHTFEAVYHSSDCDTAFKQERDKSRALGINSFPNLVIVAGTSRFTIPIDYNNAKSVLNHLDEARSLL